MISGNFSCKSGFFRTFLVNVALLFSLCAPLLLFNAYGWVHVIFLYKWLGAFLPLAYFAGFLGIMLLYDKGKIRVDVFSLLWLGLLLLLPLQLLIPDMPNRTEWLRNWLFLAALGGGYFVFSNFFPPRRLSLALRSLLVAGAFSTVFGFMQQRGIRLPFLFPSPLPDRFFANTGLDGILGVVLALASFSGVWLISYFHGKNSFWNGEHAVRSGTSEKIARSIEFPRIFFCCDLFLLGMNLVGLWKAGARSSYLAFLCALGVLFLAPLLSRAKEGDRTSSRVSGSVFFKKALPLLLVGVLFFAVLPRLAPIQRRNIQEDLSLQALNSSREGRFAIWALSLEMIREHPFFGVGLGNYKWNYLDTLPAFHKNWNMDMLYTFWAHSEYLQWVAETGIPGTLFLLILFGWWGRRVWRRLRQGDVPFSLFWGLGAVLLLGTDALFSRPFHHPESAVWLPFALAMVNVDVLPKVGMSRRGRSFFGGVVAAMAIFGIFVFIQSLPGERGFGWVSKPRSFMIVLEEGEIRLARAPLLLQDIAREVRWKESLMRTRLFDSIEMYRRTAEYLSDDYRLRPRLGILPELVEVHRKLGDAEQFDPLLEQISTEELSLLHFLPPSPVEKRLREKSAP